MYVIGKVLKPHGIKGAVKVDAITSFPEHFRELDKIYIKDGENWQNYSIESVKMSDRFVFLKLNGIHSVEEAEKLRNEFLYIREEELTELSEDEYYIHDLIGIYVYEEDGEQLGVIVDVEEYMSNDVYILKMGNGREVMLPAIKDVILDVDIQNQKMTVRVIDGLLD